MQNYSKYIDHTCLAANASIQDIKKLCHEAVENHFKSVCINPAYISLAKQELKHSNVLVCTVIGFPLGQNTITSKAFETKNAIENGADEIDMVINVSQLKAANKKYCVDEINEVVKNANNKTVKVIVETCLLDENQKQLAFEYVNASNAQFIKTSTGFSTAGAKLEDIKLWNEMRTKANSKLQIKAAGGIKTPADLEAMIANGANRIGTSKGIELIQNKQTSSGY